MSATSYCVPKVVSVPFPGLEPTFYPVGEKRMRWQLVVKHWFIAPTQLLGVERLCKDLFSLHHRHLFFNFSLSNLFILGSRSFSRIRSFKLLIFKRSQTDSCAMSRNVCCFWFVALWTCYLLNDMCTRHFNFEDPHGLQVKHLVI